MAPKFEERRRSPSETKLINPDAKPRRILLIEDNVDIREMIATALQGQGYQVDHAALPDEGIDRLRKELAKSERINQILKKTVSYFAKEE